VGATLALADAENAGRLAPLAAERGVRLLSLEEAGGPAAVRRPGRSRARETLP
jgi:hypothetical protein